MNQEFFRKYDAGWVAVNATVVREVSLGEDSSVWFQAVLRGDDAPIRLGRRVNVQDLTMIHADPGIESVIEDDVTIGHSAIVHCKRIGKGTLIGMGAIVMENVEIGEECLIAAGALVSPNTIIPPRSLVVGVPGKIKRQLTDEEVASNYRSAQHYVDKYKTYLK